MKIPDRSAARRRALPKDPAIAALVQQARASELSRRTLLTAGMGTAGLFAAGACTPPKPPATAAKLNLPKDVSATERTVKWANWTAYLDYDEDKKNYPTLEKFVKRTGIRATYSEDIEDNDSYMSKVTPQLRARQDIDRDLFCLTDWMANRVIRDRLVQPLEMVHMPNVAMRMLPALKDVTFDPGRQNSVTWQSGTVGIGYDRKKVGKELKTLDDLWNTPELKGRITVLSEMRDTLGVIMQAQGVDIDGEWGKAEFERATDEVNKRISDGTIRRIKGNSYMEDLKSGNALAGIVWSGDLFILRSETNNPNWELSIPESGSTLWSDNFMVPITSRHRASAQELINFYYEPEIAAEVAAWVNYISPVTGARAAMEKIDPVLAESPLIFPSEEWIKDNNIQGFRALTPKEDAEYSALWAKVVGN